MSVTIRLDDDLDVSRGDLLCDPDEPAGRGAATRGHGLLDERARRSGRARGSAVKHTTRTARAIVDEIRSVLDVDSLEDDESDGTSWR